MLRNRTANAGWVHHNLQKWRWVEATTFVLYNNLIIWSRHYVHRAFTSQSIQQSSYTYWDQVLLRYYCVKTHCQRVTKRWSWRWIHSQKIGNLRKVVSTNLYITQTKLIPIHSQKKTVTGYVILVRIAPRRKQNLSTKGNVSHEYEFEVRILIRLGMAASVL